GPARQRRQHHGLPARLLFARDAADERLHADVLSGAKLAPRAEHGVPHVCLGGWRLVQRNRAGDRDGRRAPDAPAANSHRQRLRRSIMSTPENQTIVIGAGVVGLSTALYLRRAGRKVTVIDPLPPAGGASFGNAGMISADTAAPIALPGMMSKIPGWLRDREGPLVVSPSYMATALPWLLRWVREGRLDRVLAI